MAVQIGSMYFSVGADTRDYQSKMAQVDATARNVADSASGSLRRIAETATGFLVAQAIPAVINGFKGLAREAFNAYGNYERLTLSLQQMAKRDLEDAATLERLTVVGQRRVELTAQETEKLQDLRLQRDLYTAQLREEEERHRQLIARWGEEGLAVQTHAARMAQLRDRYEDTAAAIANLEGKQGQMVDVVKRSTEMVLDQAEAEKRAAQITRELLDWQQQLTINSPFTAEGVQEAMRTAAAYGFVTEQAIQAAVETGKLTQEQADSEMSLQRIVQAMMDYSAGTGRTTDQMNLVALALGQIQAKGKLAGQEVLQLTNAGVNVRKVLSEAFGVTTQELVKMQEQGLIPADKAIQAIVESFEKDFGGAAKEQTRTWQGLTSTLSDLKQIGLREFFTGTFKAIQPYVADFVDKLANPETLARIREIGDALGEKIGGALERIKGIALSFQMGGVPGLLMALGVDVETVKTLETIADLVKGVFTRIGMAFQEGGLSAAIAQARDEFGKFVPGLLRELRSKAAEWGQQVREWVSGIWANVKDWWSTGGGELVTGTIERIGEWIGNVIRGLGQFSEGGRGALMEGIGKLWRGLVDWWNDGGGQIVMDTLAALGNALLEIGAALWEVGQNLAAEIGRYAHDLWYGLVNWWDTGGKDMTTDTLAKVGEWLSDLFETLADEAPGWFKEIDQWVTDLFVQVVDAIAANYPTWAEKGGQLLGEFLGKALDFLFVKLPELVGKLVAWLSGLFGGEGAGGGGEGNQVVEAVARLGDAIWEGVQRGLAAFWEALYENAPEQVQKAMDWIAGVIQGAKDGIAWLQALPEKGKDLISGMLSGVTAKTTDTLNTISSFVTTNVRGAVDWLSFLWDTGKALVDGLIKGIADQADRVKEWIIGWAKRVIPQPLWQFFGIESPSLLMMEIGAQLVAGLIEGIRNASPELVQQMAETMTSMMSAISSAFDAIGRIDRYTSVQELERKTTLLIEDIQKVVAGFLGLAGQFGGDAGKQLEKLGEVMQTLSSVFGGLSAVAQSLADLASIALPAAATRSVDAMVELLTRYIPKIVESLNAIMPDKETLTNIAMLAETADVVSTGIRSLVEAVQAIASVAGVRVEEASQRLIWMAEGLLRWVDWLRNYLGPDTLRDLSERAQEIVAALSPWQAASEAVLALSEVAGVRIETASQRLIWMVEGLVKWVNWLQTYLPEGMLEDTAETADAVTRALSPWAAAADAVQAIADVAGTRIEDASKRLIWMTEGLIRWMNWLIDYLPVGMLEAVAAKADMLVRALSPWRAVADAVQAIDAAAGARPTTHADPAMRLMFLTNSLVEWTNWLLNYLPVGVLEQVAARADMIVRALAPWKAVTDAVKAIDEAGGARPTTHADPAMRLMFLTNSLVEWTNWLLDYLPVGVLEQVAAQAEMIIKALSPWRAIVDAVAALNARITTAGIPEKANLLADMAVALALALESIVKRTTRETLEKAAVVARLLTDILDPWDRAIRLADEMRTWRLMPDLVEKFSRFARQWKEIIDDLAEALEEIDAEGLEKVEVFGSALDALVNGLEGALEIVETHQFAAPADGVWQPFVDWVWQVFDAFYNRLNGVGLEHQENVIGYEPGHGYTEGGIGLVSKFGDALGALMGGLQSALDVARNFQFTPPDAGLWQVFIDWVWGIFDAFYDRLNRVGLPREGEKPIPYKPDQGYTEGGIGLVSAFGDALTALMSGLQAALDVARNFTFSRPDPMLWQSFEDWVWSVFDSFYRKLNDVGLDQENPEGYTSDGIGIVKAFGDALTALMTGLQAALDLAMNFEFEEPDPAMWNAFENWVKAVFRSFYDWLTQEVDGVPYFDGEGIALVKAFGEALGALMTGLQSALDVAMALPDTWDVNQDVWDSFVAWVKDVFLEFYTWVNTTLPQNLPVDPGGEPGDPTTALGLVETFGSALGALMDGLASALEFALSFPRVAAFPTGPVWDNFKRWVMTVFEEFQTWVEATFHPEDPDEFAPVASFGSAMQAVFDGLLSALELFRGIVGWVGGGSVFQQNLTFFLDEVKARFLEISDYVSTELDPAVTKVTGDFGAALGDLVGGLSDALDFFEQIASADPAVYTATHEFKVRVQTLLRSIHEVMEAFQTYIETEEASLWLPTANHLLEAFGTMIDVLRDALNLFVDLNASNLPTPNKLQEFIGLVILLFQQLTGAILGAGIGVEQGATDVTTALNTSLGKMRNYVPEFEALGITYANAMAKGIRNATGAVSGAAKELGDAAASGTANALQIASPSRVAMGLGEFFVTGFVRALLSGRSEVEAAMQGLMLPQMAMANDGFQVDTRRHIVVEFRGQAGGGVPLPGSQFDALKRELIWELQRGA